MVYIFEFMNKAPQEDNSVIVINDDLSAAIVGATMSGYCSEDDARQKLSILCVNTSRGEWRVIWKQFEAEDLLIGLHAEIAVSDIISRLPSESTSEWDYWLKQID